MGNNKPEIIAISVRLKCKLYLGLSCKILPLPLFCAEQSSCCHTTDVLCVTVAMQQGQACKGSQGERLRKSVLGSWSTWRPSSTTPGGHWSFSPVLPVM